MKSLAAAVTKWGYINTAHDPPLKVLSQTPVYICTLGQLKPF